MIYFIGILCLITFVYCFSISIVAIGFIKFRDKKNNFEKNGLKKDISIIIAVRNEEDSILDCLESIANQDYQWSNFEIIIVNDHSFDRTIEIINTYVSGNELPIRVFDLDTKTSKKEALKLGIEKSKFDLIATTDADCILPKNWLKNISIQFSNDTSMLLGPVMFKRGSGFLSSFQTLDMLAIQGIEYGMLYYDKPILNNAANLSYKKESYLSVNGLDDFKTPSGDDIFLLEKFKAHNQKVEGLLSKDFITETNSEATIRGFFNQRLRWASKSKYYSDEMLVNSSILILLQNLLLIFIYILIFFVEKYNLQLIILFLSKWLIDFILLFLVAKFFNRKKVLWYFIPVQIVYPIYVLVIWVGSITIKFDWKGRSFNE